MLSVTGRAWIGISGWLYRPWRGVFYPRGLKQAQELAFASNAFDSIEINGSFYSLMRPETYQSWYDQTPAGFIFAVKGGRYITHMKRLQNVELGYGSSELAQQRRGLPRSETASLPKGLDERTNSTAAVAA